MKGRKEIADIKFGPNEHQDTGGHRGVVVDLYCIGPDNEQFIVEMQRAGLEYFKDRSLYYTSRIVSRLEKKGKENWNYQLPHVFFIGIMDFRFNKEQQEKYIHDVRLVEVETNKEFYDKLGYIFIELPNFVKEYDENDDPDEISGIDKWIYVLKHLSKLKALPKFLDKRIFTKLFQIAEIGNLNTDDMRTYEASLKAKRDYYSAMSYTQKQAKEEGKIEGKIEMIKKLITILNYTDQQAADFVEVSVDFVENIRKELNK